jgi:F0F1-type ATP synthase epsilon subunit
MNRDLRLLVRTPVELLLDVAVRRISAEDLDGWFGIAPGRADVVAVLPPGVLTFVEEATERFLGHAGGLLDLRAGECRVLVGDAALAGSLEEIGGALDKLLAGRSRRRGVHEALSRDLATEILRRLAVELES